MSVQRIFAFVALCIAFGCATCQGQQDDERVEDFLRRLQLDSVLIEHLQQQLNRTIDRVQRVEIARRLAGLYSEAVFSGQHGLRSEKQFKAIIQLSRDFPEIASEDLKMTVLHSEYAKAEAQFLQWMDRERDGSRQVELAASFRDLGGRLRSQISRLENTIFEGSDARLYAQANYLYGWVSYYMGVLKPSERKVWMQRSNSSFRDFLDLDPKKPISQFSNDWFEVQSPWHARAQVGLAMGLQGLGEPEESTFCFKVLESLETHSSVRENLDVWRLNSLVYVDKMEEALIFLRRRTAGSEQDLSLRTRLWVAAVDAASTCKDGLYSKTGVQFLRFGLHGLASDMNASVLRDVVERESLNLEGEDFLLAWCRGYLDYFRGESTKDPADFAMARSELSWAVSSASSSTDVGDLARCQFLLGLIDFQLNDYENAVESFRQSLPALVEDDSDLASEAQWLVVRSLQTLAKSDPRFANDAFEAMDKLARSFPNSKYVRRVEFEKLLMEIAKFPPEEALRRLNRIQREDPNYQEAVFQKVILQHRIWWQFARSNHSNTQDAFDRLLDLESSFQKLKPLPPIRLRTKAMLTTIDALIRTGGKENIGLAKRAVSSANAIADSLDPTSPLASELRYYRFQMAKAEEDFEQMDAEATWFFEKLPSSKYTQSALVGVAQMAQSRFDAIQEPPSREQLAELVSHFERLTRLLGFAPDQLKESQNARYSAAKLAEYQYRLGNFDRSLELAGNLREAFPKRKAYWMLLSRTQMKLGLFEEALVGWRKIVASSESGDESWYEAKLGIVRSLAGSDPMAAKSVLLQTLNLSPDCPERWEPEFKSLARALDVSLSDQLERED